MISHSIADIPRQHSSQHSLPINRVLIVGGTHGNELTGIYTIQKFKHHPELIHRHSFDTLTVIGNPDATKHVTRYRNKDLNRCFNAQTWDPSSTSIYEVKRAKTLLEQYGPESDQPTGLVIDLHSTTSNAGLMLILDHLDPFTLGLAAYLQMKEPMVKIYSAVGSGREHDSLRTVGKYRLGIEVGPIAHGTLHAELFTKTEALIYHALDYVERHNQRTTSNSTTTATATALPTPTDLTIYHYLGTIDYPKNEHGAITAMIHPHRQFQDYQAVHPGDPMFLTFQGETINYAGKTTVHPIFINESAYYEKGIAMSLTTMNRARISP